MPCRQEGHVRLGPPMPCFAMQTVPAAPATVAQPTAPTIMLLLQWQGRLGTLTVPRSEMLLAFGCRWQWEACACTCFNDSYPERFRAATQLRCSSNHSRRWLASLVAGADVAGIPACASVALVDDATGEAVAFEQVHTGGSG